VTLRSLPVDGEGRSSAEARFSDLYDRYYAQVHTYCRRRVDTTRVDDAVAETFLTAWRRIDDVPAGDLALPWLYRVAYRVVGHQWRSRSRRRRLDDRLAAVPDPPTPTTDETVVTSDELQRVLDAAGRLNQRDAEILRLLSWERLNRDEIATALEIAPNAVSQRIHRARENLTQEYERLERHDRDRTPAARKGGKR